MFGANSQNQLVTLLLQWNNTTAAPEMCQTSDCALAACQGFGVMVRSVEHLA